MQLTQARWARVKPLSGTVPGLGAVCVSQPSCTKADAGVARRMHANLTRFGFEG